MKSLFKSRPRSPPELVRHVRDLILQLDSNSPPRSSRKNEKLTELAKNLRELKDILYGEESGPVAEACCKVTQEFFRENTFRLLIDFLPKLNLEARKDATEIVRNLQRRRVNCKLIASDYLESNKDLMDHLIVGYEDMDIALHTGPMLRECIRHQNVTRYVLQSQHMIKFFDYIQNPNYDVASDAFATFKELLTRHKSTVAEYLENNYDWFFTEYNLRLLKPEIYITRRQSTKLLGEILLDRSNSSIMMLYVNSKENLKILMDLLKESSPNISLPAFDVFKLFVANTNKPPEIVNVLVANKSKLLRLLDDFKPGNVAGDFETDKTLVVNLIATLQPIMKSST